MATTIPGYLALHQRGELAARARWALDRLSGCTLCARRCHADRTGQQAAEAFCQTGRHACVSSYFPHHGEETCLSGSGGSGTIFFSHCSLRCVFCQNYEISCLGEGRAVGPERLAEVMLRLQDEGCHNINLVTPSHVVAQILEALPAAVDGGLNLPLVYNSGGYDRVETLARLDGVIDIYMPDLKLGDSEVSAAWLDAPDYPQVACDAVSEMHRQVGDLDIGPDGLARRGLLVRHLVMPGRLEDTRYLMQFVAREISPDCFVNLMPQYHPAGLAHRFPGLERSLDPVEYAQAVDIARQAGLRRICVR